MMKDSQINTSTVYVSPSVKTKEIRFSRVLCLSNNTIRMGIEEYDREDITLE